MIDLSTFLLPIIYTHAHAREKISFIGIKKEKYLKIYTFSAILCYNAIMVKIEVIKVLN